MKTVPEVVRAAETNLLMGTTKLGKYVNRSHYETVERIYATLHSKHISGETDSQGRVKPYFNISIASANIWDWATAIKQKNIRIMPDKLEDTGLALIATVHLHEWMRKARFGVFLKEWGRTLSRFGSCVSKFVEQNGELTCSVIPWNRFIADPVDFDAIPHIEKFYKTEEQLYKMADENGYDKKMVEALCNAISTRKNIDKTQQDNQSNFIELYEVHGRMSKAVYLKSKGLEPKEEDDDIYFQQMHVISFVATEEGHEDFTLFSGKEKKDPYMITHLVPEDGCTLSIGAIEAIFDPQWMNNHSVKNIKDTLDIASKLVFQTADSRYVGRNILSAIETGDIFIHKENMPLTRVANDKPDIVALQNFSTMWQNIAQQITSTPDAMRGSTLPSGTPYALGTLLQQQSNHPFEQMLENKGLSVTDMMTTHIIPFLITKMDTKEEIVATLDEQGITEIDAMYVPNQAIKNYNALAVHDVLHNDMKGIMSGAIKTYPEMQSQMEGGVKQGLAPHGNKRSFKPDELSWKLDFKDFKWQVIVEVTSENTDKQAVLTSLSTAFQTIASLAGRPMTPDERLIFSKIMQETGSVSPLQLSIASAQPSPVPSVVSPTASPPVAAPVA
jgi:hypothetical protein